MEEDDEDGKTKDEELSDEERMKLFEKNEPPPGVDSEKFVDDGEGLDWQDTATKTEEDDNG